MTPEHFRRLCGQFATGVVIITTIDEHGKPCGMTANSFASVSLDPPLISVAIDHAATIFPAMQGSLRFTVNVLTTRQEPLSRRFAAGLDDRFDGVDWLRDNSGQVILEDSLAHICCEKWAEVPAGDHTIFIGQVVAGATNPDGKPLLHVRGAYQHAPRSW